MLHHEESPEKPHTVICNPPFLEKPNPHFALPRPPPFSSKNFQTCPSFLSILKK